MDVSLIDTCWTHGSDTCWTHGYMGRTLACDVALAWPSCEGHILSKIKMKVVTKKHIPIISGDC